MLLNGLVNSCLFQKFPVYSATAALWLTPPPHCTPALTELEKTRLKVPC
jgi:hypothetical protein